MQDERIEVRKKAMSLLEHSDKTEWQLRQKLLAKEYSEEAVEEAIAYVKSFHYLDDLRFAVHYAELYSASRSLRRIRQDLYQKHVPEEYIDIAMDSIERDESMALKKDLKKLAKGRESLTEEDGGLSYEERQKIAAKLFRKGYEMHSIKKALNI